MLSASDSTLFTLVPASTSTSNKVTVGPRWALGTRAATPNVRNVRSRAAVVCSSSRLDPADAGAVRSRPIGGSLYAPPFGADVGTKAVSDSVPDGGDAGSGSAA